MEFVNETNTPAALTRTLLEDDTKILGVVVAKRTYRFDAWGRVVRDYETALPVLKHPVEQEWGTLPSDRVPYKHGVDLFAFGHAYAPHGRPATASWVTLQVGSLQRRLAVFGDRFWKRGGSSHTPPRPFETMPLTWKYAYGGKALREGNEVPNGYNPHGKGYVLVGEDAEGVALPNVEDPEQLVTTWNRKPVPMTFGPVPPYSQFGADDTFDIDQRTGEWAFRGKSYNAAHPKLRPHTLRPNEWFQIDGMTPDGPVRFALPHEPMSVHVSLANRHYTFPTTIDTIGVIVPERRFFLVHRCRFTYAYIREEIRTTRLRRAN